MGTQEEQITHNKTGEAKLNMQNTGRDTVKIKRNTLRGRLRHTGLTLGPGEKQTWGRD